MWSVNKTDISVGLNNRLWGRYGMLSSSNTKIVSNVFTLDITSFFQRADCRDVFITPGWRVISYGLVIKLYDTSIPEMKTIWIVTRSVSYITHQGLSMLTRAVRIQVRLQKFPMEAKKYLESLQSIGCLGCAFWDWPLVTVTVWDGEEVGVEDSKIHCKSRDDMQAVVVLTAASICTLKHAWWAKEQELNSILYQRTLCMQASTASRDYLPDLKSKSCWLQRQLLEILKKVL